MARAQRWLSETLRLNHGDQQSYHTVPNADPADQAPRAEEAWERSSETSSELEVKRLHDELGKISKFEYMIFVFLGIAM